MVEGLVVAEPVPQGLLQWGACGQEPMVCGPPPQDFPEARDDLQLRAIARQSGQPQLRQLVEHLGAEAATMPGRMVDDEHDVGV